MGADKALRQSRTAASWAAMALQDDPDLQPGFRVGAASNAMAGRPEQARKAVARLRQLNPGLVAPGGRRGAVRRFPVRRHPLAPIEAAILLGCPIPLIAPSLKVGLDSFRRTKGERGCPLRW